MAERKKQEQRQQEGQTLPVRREERGITPFEEGFDTPFTMLRRFRDEIDRMFEDFGMPTFGRWSISPFERVRRMFPLERMTTMMPAIDEWETEDEVIVRADIPGVDPNDVQIYTTEDSLRISAETKHEEEREEGGYHRAERRYGRYERVIDLPADVIPDQAKAIFKHGVLEVRLPKTQEAKERMRRIPVEVEEEQLVGAKGGEAKEEKGRSRRK